MLKSVTVTAIVKLMADGQFHSGSEIGHLLGLSRAAVWKIMKSIRENGISVEAVNGKGYRVPGGLDPLDATVICQFLSPDARRYFTQIEVVQVIESTNTRASEYVRNVMVDGVAGGYACLAEQQTHGRGRRGRTWVSPFGRSVYLSVVWRFEAGFSAIQGLSLAVGVSVCEVVESLGGGGVWLKWPNDIYHGQQKLGGILVDVAGDADGSCIAVIGVGVNADIPEDAGAEIDKPWTDMAKIGVRADRNLVASRLLSGIFEMLVVFEREGFVGALPAWKRFDGLTGKAVTVDVGGVAINGDVAGIDSSGALILDTSSGRKLCSAGEVSIRCWS